MEITKSRTRPYGFTLRKTTLTNVTEEAYRKHMDRLPWEIYTDVAFEQEAGLHCHGVAYIARAVDMKRFSFRGWHIHFEELYDPQQWMIYCNKHQSEPTPDMTDTPKEEDFIPPKKKMFPKINRTVPIQTMKGGDEELESAKHKIKTIKYKPICYDNEFINTESIKRVIKEWSPGLPQTYEYGFDNGD